MTKTYSFNQACIKLECMFGDGITVKTSGNGVHSGFYLDGCCIAEYNEDTGHLVIHKVKPVCTSKMVIDRTPFVPDMEEAILARQDARYDD